MALDARQAIDEFGPALARIAACHERDPARRDELLEEIFLAIASSVPRMRDTSRRRTFLFRVAHNRAATFAQRLHRAPLSADERAGESTRLDAIRALILPHRLAITLLFEDLRESEISEVLGIPIGRVRLHIEHGKRQLAGSFDDLRDCWRNQHVGARPPRAWLRIRGRWPRIPLVVQLSWATAGMLMGLWLALLAWRFASIPSGLYAVVLLLTAPALAIGAFLARKENLQWESESPGSVLVCGRYRVEASLMAIRLGRGYVCLVGSHVAVLWISELGGLISAREFLEFYSGIWAAAVMVYLPWLSACERRLCEERAITRRLLGEVTSADS